MREEYSLREGLARQAHCAAALEEIAGRVTPSREMVEAQSLCVVGEAILRSALARTESRGAHFRADYPRRDDEKFQKHSVFEGGEVVAFAV